MKYFLLSTSTKLEKYNIALILSLRDRMVKFTPLLYVCVRACMHKRVRIFKKRFKFVKFGIKYILQEKKDLFSCSKEFFEAFSCTEPSSQYKGISI